MPQDEFDAVKRVRALAQSWASLPALDDRRAEIAADIDRHVGREILGMLDSSTAADIGLSRVVALAEQWMAPGGLALFYPAAGQAVFDAIRGGSTDEEAGWRERAGAAETALEHAKAALAGDNEGIRLWMLDCAELVDRARVRAGAAEAKLAEIWTYCRERPELAGAGFPQMAADILAIIGSEGETEPALPVAAVLSEDIRIRLARAMYDSVDRCARCKVCEHQIGAAVKVMAEAVAAERERIRQLADRTQAVCTGDEGTSCYFSALLEPVTESWEQCRG
jgi:hypothetical protein